MHGRALIATSLATIATWMKIVASILQNLCGRINGITELTHRHKPERLRRRVPCRCKSPTFPGRVWPGTVRELRARWRREARPLDIGDVRRSSHGRYGLSN